MVSILFQSSRIWKKYPFLLFSRPFLICLWLQKREIQFRTSSYFVFHAFEELGSLYRKISWKIHAFFKFFRNLNPISPFTCMEISLKHANKFLFFTISLFSRFSGSNRAFSLFFSKFFKVLFQFFFKVHALKVSYKFLHFEVFYTWYEYDRNNLKFFRSESSS